uniref:Uncharacterized protein n=1 Tax=Caenorhabditis tropicalis TaxID=1561998 RepID=A0A1I7URY6_9PELO
MSSDCKLVRELCEKVSKLITAYKEHREQVKRESEPPQPEEIEMTTFWRRPMVSFAGPEERWSEIRREIFRRQPVVFWKPTAPIKIIRPKRVQDW